MENSQKAKSLYSRGFTLIELLVVVAIIGVLASIALASFNSARARAKDGAIKSNLTQFRTLLGLEYSENGSYTNLQPDLWFPADIECDDSAYGFSGNYANQATEICNSVTSLARYWGWNSTPGALFYAGNITSNDNNYSMMAPLNSSDTFYCLGNSGASDTETGATFIFSATGCYDNP